MALTELVTDPDSFMDRKIRGRSLRWETVLVLVIGGLGAVGPAYVSQFILGELPEEQGAFLEFQLLGFTLEPIIGIFVLWFAAAVVAHLVASRVYNGRGPIRRLLKSSAWALVPIGVGNLARSLGLFVAFQGVDVPDSPEGATLGEQFQSVLAVGIDQPAVLVAGLVLVVTVVLSGYLLSFSVKHAKGISEDDARKTAAVPMGAFALFLLWGLV